MRATDTELVDELAHGDRGAFTELMRRHGPAVFKYAWALADDTGQVDDLLQETFLVLWKRRKKVTLPSDSVLPWLLTTCRYVAFNTNRKARLRRTIPLDVSHAEELAHVDAREELAWVRVEISNLSSLDQQILHLCLTEGRTYDDAAAQLGISPSAARKRMQRTRARLAELRSE